MFNLQTVSFLNALSQLCHSNTELAHNSWLEMFPRIWKLLTDRQQAVCRKLRQFSILQKEVNVLTIFINIISKYFCNIPTFSGPCW